MNAKDVEYAIRQRDSTISRLAMENFTFRDMVVDLRAAVTEMQKRIEELESEETAETAPDKLELAL